MGSFELNPKTLRKICRDTNTYVSCNALPWHAAVSANCALVCETHKF